MIVYVWRLLCSLCHKESIRKVTQSGPENFPVNILLLHSKTKTFVGTDLSAFFQFGTNWTVRFTRPVVWCAAMGEMAGRTARDKCRQNIMHVWSASIALQSLLYRSQGRKDSSSGHYIRQNCSRTPTTHMASPWINFCPGSAGCLRQFGTNLSYPYTIICYVAYECMYTCNLSFLLSVDRSRPPPTYTRLRTHISHTHLCPSVSLVFFPMALYFGAVCVSISMSLFLSL